MSKLYLVPTPIGNLEDMTFRAITVLKDVDFILAEDTRTSGKLLKHFDINTQMHSHHMHNEHKSVKGVVQRIKNGESCALISDAGTPAISDPGFLLTRTCIENSVEVECLPGATAFVPALVNSGFPNDRFIFEGFLPIKKGRQTRLLQLAEEKRTMVVSGDTATHPAHARALVLPPHAWLNRRASPRTLPRHTRVTTEHQPSLVAPLSTTSSPRAVIC